jgi:hypothetical protein
MFDKESPLLLNITDEHESDTGEQYYILGYCQSPGYGPVLYNGQNRKYFNSFSDCYPYDDV